MPWAVQQPTCVSTQPTLCVIGMLRVERTFNAKGRKTGNLSLRLLRTERRGRSTGSTRPDVKDVRGRGNASYHRQGPPPFPRVSSSSAGTLATKPGSPTCGPERQAARPGGGDFPASSRLEHPFER